MARKVKEKRPEAHLPAGPEARKAVKPKPEEIEKELEDALEQTFPASDPVAMESTLVAGRGRRH